MFSINNVSLAKAAVLIFCFAFTRVAVGQTIGGFAVSDYLVSAVHPNGCEANYVTGPPDDSTWVNFNDGDVTTGTFGLLWVDEPGDELLLETSYHSDNYAVRLILTSGAFSDIHFVNQPDWTQITDTPWIHLFLGCDVGTFGLTRYILPLDFSTHFGLTQTDTVTGIEITFLQTGGAPDFAGAYIINAEPACGVDLGNDVTLCDGEMLTLNATTSNASYLWQDGSTASSLDVSTTGTYAVTVSYTDCIASDSVNITFNPIPNVNLGNDTALCDGDTLLLDVFADGAAYVWHDASTNPFFAVVQEGNYAVTVTIDGCSAADTIAVVFPIDNFDLGDDTSLCDGQLLALDPGINGALYQWQDGSTAAVFTVQSEGTYTVSVTLGGCTTIDSVTVTFNPVPVADLGDDAAICDGDTLMLDAFFSDAFYTWQDNSSASSFAVTAAGLYAVTLNIGACADTDSVLVAVKLLPQVDLGNDTVLCFGDEMVLNATLQNATYTWNNGSTNSTQPVTEEGTYAVTVLVDGCVGFDAMTVDYSALQHVDLGNDTTICEEANSFIIDASFPGATYTWQDLSNGSQLEITASGTYAVTVTLAACAVSDSINVAFEVCVCKAIIPNAFTPNGDNHNDLFSPVFNCVPTSYRLSVYDRWGMMIFESTNPLARWNGMFNGEDSPCGTYAYSVTYGFENESPVAKHGNVTLLR